jgi:hypothetical protein
LKLKERYYEIILSNLAYRQLLWDWHLLALKNNKPTDKLELLLRESQDAENFTTLVWSKLERAEYLLFLEKSITFELSNKIIELEKQLELTKQIEQL